MTLKYLLVDGNLYDLALRLVAANFNGSLKEIQDEVDKIKREKAILMFVEKPSYLFPGTNRAERRGNKPKTYNKAPKTLGPKAKGFWK